VLHSPSLPPPVTAKQWVVIIPGDLPHEGGSLFHKWRAAKSGLWSWDCDITEDQTRDRWLLKDRLWEKEDFTKRVTNALRNVNKNWRQSRVTVHGEDSWVVTCSDDEAWHGHHIHFTICWPSSFYVSLRLFPAVFSHAFSFAILFQSWSFWSFNCQSFPSVTSCNNTPFL